MVKRNDFGVLGEGVDVLLIMSIIYTRILLRLMGFVGVIRNLLGRRRLPLLQ